MSAGQDTNGNGTQTLDEREFTLTREDLSTLLDEAVSRTVDTRPVVHDEGPNRNLFDSELFSQCQRVAQGMAKMSTIPDCLSKGRDKRPLPDHVVLANCFRIVNQAYRWDIDPYAMLDHVYVVGGKLAYDGQLTATIVNARAGLVSPLSYTFSGEGADLEVTVSGMLHGEDIARTASLTLKLAKSRSDPKSGGKKWADPEQGLVYSGSVKWARRHCPHVLLGVKSTYDDMEETKPVEKPTNMEELKQLLTKKPEPKQEEPEPELTHDETEDKEAAIERFSTDFTKMVEEAPDDGALFDIESLLIAASWLPEADSARLGELLAHKRAALAL